MKPFLSARSSFLSLGIDSNQSSLNGNALFFFGAFAFVSISYVAQIFKISTFSAYIEIMFWTSAHFVLALVYTIKYFKAIKIFEFLDRFERIVSERKLNTFIAIVGNTVIVNFVLSLSGHRSSILRAKYKRTHYLAEKMCKILDLVVGKLSPTIWIWSKCFKCYFVYFTTDLGGDAFELPLPMS